MKRQEAREIAMQMLFQMDAQQDYGQEIKERFLALNPVSEAQTGYVESMYDILSAHIDEIDEKLSAASENWKINRIAKVDLAILRLAIAEIFYNEEIPAGVSINEAVELAKKFGTEDSGKYVNGVLGKVVRDRSE